MSELSDIRLIAFYLPQYHPIPENDRWWGKGFTEWTNVAKGRPNFEGHYQPHLPADLGFYDLRVPEVRAEQAKLAREYGIYGFCYYYYWFGGKRLLERPLNAVLESKQPDFPFCVCWANENWTRRWDGREHEILMAQDHSLEDDRALIHSLIPVLQDERYIRVHGKPLVLIYRIQLLPDAAQTAQLWREECRKAGIGEIFLGAVQSFEIVDPRAFGFDGAIEFPPHGMNGQPINHQVTVTNPHFEGFVFDYEQVVANSLSRPQESYPLFRGVMPSWDNTARRQDKGQALINSSPANYEFWLSQIVQQARQKPEVEERIIFINAWNEWGEGCHLEPDVKYGHQYLEATKNALQGIPTQRPVHPSVQQLEKQLQQLKVELLQTQNEVRHWQNHLHQAEHYIGWMKTSKFWKLRSSWAKLGQKLGLKAAPDPLTYSPLAVPVQPVPLYPLPALPKDDRKKVLFISHDATRTGAPIIFLHFLRWFKQHGQIPFLILLRNGGELESEFQEIAPTINLEHFVAHSDELVDYLMEQHIGLIYSNTMANGRVLELLSTLNCPVVSHIHELEQMLRYHVGLDIFEMTKQQTQRYIAVSQAVKANLVQNHAIAPEAIEVIYEFIPARQNQGFDQKQAREQVCRKLGIAPDSLIVGGSGTTDWRKGPDLFVQLAHAVQQRQPESPVHFLWVGGDTEGSVYSKLQYDLERAGLKGKVHFVGSQPDPLNYFAAFDIFALMSREDPFPLVSLEAASLGKPILCFAQSGGGQELVEQDSGFVVPYLDTALMAEKVLVLLQSPELRWQLGQQAQQKVSTRHDVEVTAPQVLQLIQQLL